MSLFTLERQPLTLRPYQRDAVASVYRHLHERDDNPCVVIPTGGGKTPVMATICADSVGRWRGRVLILAHVRELLEQAADKLDHVCPDIHVGIYSAGLKRRDTEHPVIIAGIQSVYRRAEDLDAFDLIVVDEAHMIPPEGDGMYRQFIADARRINPHVRIIGLTATPFRMKSGPIRTADGILNAICYEVGVRELIRDGYLSALRTKAGREKVSTDQLHVRAGEFVADEVEALMDQDRLVHAACAEIVEYTKDRRACLIFASGVRHGQHVAAVLEKRHGVECGFIDGETADLHRDRLIRRFRDGELKYLCNVNVLTMGFDAPNVDCAVLLRPTLSPGLYYQMVGRGFRLCPGKTDCLVLDFGGNVLRHGPVDQIRVGDVVANGNGTAPAKECPQCHELIAAGYATCPDCGYEFPPPERKQHDASASSDGILSDQTSRAEHEVTEVFYGVHVKRGAPPDAPRTMRVDYRIGFNQYVSEWVCFEHSGFAREKAERWWCARSNEPVPDTIEDAVELAEAGALARTLAITVEQRPGDKFDRVVGYQLGERPPRLDSEEGLPECTPASEEVPF
jgi:DNA repair protein RadD